MWEPTRLDGVLQGRNDFVLVRDLSKVLGAVSFDPGSSRVGGHGG